jgi:hypothetical protein
MSKDEGRTRDRLGRGEFKVAILGLGPSAAFAYRACRFMGVQPHVYGIESAPTRGAFWIYWMPPHLDAASHSHPVNGAGRVAPSPIQIIGKGTAQEYVYKQWGRGDIPSSFPERSPRQVMGYDPKACMELLWQGFSPRHKVHGPLDDEIIMEIAGRYDLVLQTFPRVVPAAATEVVRIPIVWKRSEAAAGIGNTVVYNGVPGNIVRSSWLWGVEAHELLSTTDPGYLDTWLDNGFGVDWRKDIRPEAKQGIMAPLAPNVKYLGRYAMAARKMLSHEAYGLTMRFLDELSLTKTEKGAWAP